MDEANPSNPESNDKSDDWKSYPPEQFLSIVLHELRTPIMIIKGYTTILSDEKHKDIQPEAVGAISQAAERLELLMNDIADYCRAQ